MENLIIEKEFKKKKNKPVYCRMDETMLAELFHIQEKTGITRSELIREAARRLIIESQLIGVSLST